MAKFFADTRMRYNAGLTAFENARLYHKDEEVQLFWKNIMSYYIKQKISQTKNYCMTLLIRISKNSKTGVTVYVDRRKQELELIALAKQKYEETQIRAYQIIAVCWAIG